MSQANPRTIVVLISGNSVAMPWIDQVPAIVEGWYCGSESKADYEDVAEEIHHLREQKQNTLVENANRDELRKRIAECERVSGGTAYCY